MRGYLHNLSGHNVLFCMAAPAEYGEFLKQRFTPLMIGVGPIEAAINLSVALAGNEYNKTINRTSLSVVRFAHNITFSSARLLWR